MKFIFEELNLVQVLKLIGGVVGLVLLYSIYKKI